MKIYEQIPELKSTAVALGCFDGIHLGHRAVIEKLSLPEYKNLNKAVFSFSDAPIFKEGAESLASFNDKCELLSELGISKLIFPSFNSIKDYSPKEFFTDILIRKLDARLLACGENYRFGKRAAGNSTMLSKLCEENGIECIIVPPVTYRGKIISSSRIREALSKGDVKSASRMLGRQFSYRLRVVHGRQLGRQLGTPTINQYFPENFIIPAFGVYASITEIDGLKYPSVTNIGVKPTVGSSIPLSETWIIGYSGDLYGQHIRVTLVSYMRNECKFSSIDTLKQAIQSDGANSVSLTKKYLK